MHLRPTFFAQWLLYPFSRATIVEEGIIDLPYGEGRHAPIAAEDQARLIAAILAEPAAHLGKTYTLHGPIELSRGKPARFARCRRPPAEVASSIAADLNLR